MITHVELCHDVLLKSAYACQLGTREQAIPRRQALRESPDATLNPRSS